MTVRTRATAALTTVLAMTLVGTLSLPGASAAPPLPSDLTVDIEPVLGTGSALAVGWNEVLVTLVNNRGRLARGRVDVSIRHLRGDKRSFRATAPYAVAAGSSVNLRVPMLVGPFGDVDVEVWDEGGGLVSERTLSTFQSPGVTLLDLTEASHVRGALNEMAVAPLTGPVSASRGTVPQLSVATTRTDPATGDPIVPDRPALYGSIDAVLVRSDVLAHLAAAELEALTGYVLAGGTIAIAVARPEDVRHRTFEALAGGAVQKQGVSAATLAELKVVTPAGTNPGKTLTPAREPSADLAAALVGYVGGNLHASAYGSSAAYGLGEVHVLAFDPTRKPAADDPWAQVRVVDLARRAHDRRVTQAVRPGSDLKHVTYERVRRALDPNESSRWAIFAAALLLVGYAILAGPVSFSIASKRGKPLLALRWLPMISGITFALIVAIGVAAKGVTGRARHLTLVEAGAGMARGSARRFRGFYASRASDLTVRTTDASSVVATAVADYGERLDHLIVDREGARLVDVSALPWQIVIAREDGLADLGGGVALVKDGATGVAVVNRSGHDLRGAVLRTPAGEGFYFPRIRDGERETTTSALSLSTNAAGRVWLDTSSGPSSAGARVGSMEIQKLEPYALRDVVETDTPGLGEAWVAVNDASGDEVDWFPHDVPVLIAQIEGGEGRRTDSGLRLESDRVLVRVVGYGGRP